MRDGERQRRLRMLPPRRRAMPLIVLFAVLGLVLILAPDVLLVIFAGLLLGVFFAGGGAAAVAAMSRGDRAWPVGPAAVRARMGRGRRRPGLAEEDR